VAKLYPIQSQTLTVPAADETCGDRIAARLVQQGPGPITERLPTRRHCDTRCRVCVQEGAGARSPGREEPAGRISAGEPAANKWKTLRVQLLIWPGKTVSLGSLGPDPGGTAAFTYSFEETYPAPVEYYYSLGFSYVYLDQCSKGLPWLNISLDIDSSAANPAWQGLNECAAGESTPESGVTPAAE